MKGKEFIEQYEELQDQNDNFNKCIFILNANSNDGNDKSFATESIKILEEKQAVVLLKINRLEKMDVD